MFNYTKTNRVLGKIIKNDKDYEYLYFLFRDFKFGKLPNNYLGKVSFTFTKVAFQMENVKYALQKADYITA